MQAGIQGSSGLPAELFVPIIPTLDDVFNVGLVSDGLEDASLVAPPVLVASDTLTRSGPVRRRLPTLFLIGELLGQWADA